MNTVKITCDTGRTWTTSISCTLDDARKYFIDQRFTCENETGNETVDIVVSVEEVEGE